ncbi:outer membrane protein assembly factor BamE [Mariprofundus erugo]|uniref:outer membrane protein assembly factor BamE n=1 Tax=Mariprofundus erugo TaxID=2528639 RepID=UPI0010FDA2CE|nr:outer membrane protein assembly factor BamE [Mariprofundus erugo]TLS76200.1 outer membrane protein assembly factor BamE [Mariprofundus erugo]
MHASRIAILILLLAGCTAEPIHQGNRLEVGKVDRIQKGDTKFHIEQILGAPTLNDAMHPDRAVYYEEYEDKDSGKLIKRRVEIRYDDAKRVTDIERFGFDKQVQKSE